MFPWGEELRGRHGSRDDARDMFIAMGLTDTGSSTASSARSTTTACWSGPSASHSRAHLYG